MVVNEHVDTFTGDTFITESDERLLFDAFHYRGSTDEALNPLHCGPLVLKFPENKAPVIFHMITMANAEQHTLYLRVFTVAV